MNVAKKSKPTSKSAKPAKVAAKPAAKAAPVKAAPKAPAKVAAKPVAKPAAKPVAAVKAAAPAKPAAKAAPAKAAPSAPVKVAAKPAAPAPKGAVKPAAKVAAPVAKAPAGKAPAKAPAKAATPAAPAAAAAAAAVDPKKPVRKGITIVTPKPVKKAKPKPPTTSNIAHLAGQLLGSGAVRKPLIPSGPHASAVRPLGAQGPEPEQQSTAKAKSPFGKKDLERFRQILLRKRAELFGDVTNMESEALKGNSGSLSNLPQHIAEQGSDTYDQSLSLDLAAADRKLIKEIDDALKRIEDGTYGICEITGKPIKAERLEELPWARHSIEAARALERRQMMRT